MTTADPTLKGRYPRDQRGGGRTGPAKRAAQAGQAPVKEPVRPSSPEPREWAVFVFMKPDDSLERSAIENLEEMKAVGAIPRAYVAVQVERRNDVERLEIEGGRETLHSHRGGHAVAAAADAAKAAALYAEETKEQSSKLEDSVREFATWAMREFPAYNHLAVMWGHARGVGALLAPPNPADFTGNPFREWEPVARVAKEDPEPPASRSSTPKPPTPRPLASRRVPVPLPTGITIGGLVDVLKRMHEDAAKSGKLRQYLTGGSATIPDPSKLAVLGLDSCYMSNVELAYELRPYVNFLVASESFMFNQSWDYREVLGQLTASDSIDPQGLGEAIVNHVTTLPKDSSISMVTLAQVDALATAFTELIARLRAAITVADDRRALKIVLARASFLMVRQFLDLRDLCHKITDEFGGDIKDAAKKVLDSLEPAVFHRATGRALGRLNGLSIFYPYVRARAIRAASDDIPEVNAIVSRETYRTLSFVSRTGWGDLLDMLYRD